MLEIIESKNEINDFFENLNKRGNVNNSKYSEIVKGILDNVLKNGDQAILEYTKKFDDDNFSLDKMEIPMSELKEAYESLDEKTKNILNRAHKRIEDYHKHQLKESWMYEDSIGAKLGMKYSPIENVGVYVPGGLAAYPSSVLMNIIPAKVAGCKNITMVTPMPKGIKNPLVLAAAYVSGCTKCYRIGGAQAIGALAYGTKTIKKVDKIVGPGNIYVALAKREVYGLVGIDSIAGPSEICIIADKTCNPTYLAYDLLAQAEHDVLASSVLFVTDKDVALKIKNKANELASTAKRNNILERSLTDFSKIIIVKDLDEACMYANMIAPEHLELAFDDANSYVDKIHNAGAIFIGHYSAESFGDYMSGPNHVLPTVKTARFFSPLNVDDFMKKTSLQCLSKDAALALVDDVYEFATLEGLEMHARAALARKE